MWFSTSSTEHKFTELKFVKQNFISRSSVKIGDTKNRIEITSQNDNYISQYTALSGDNRSVFAGVRVGQKSMTPSSDLETSFPFHHNLHIINISYCDRLYMIWCFSLIQKFEIRASTLAMKKECIPTSLVIILIILALTSAVGSSIGNLGNKDIQSNDVTIRWALLPFAIHSTLSGLFCSCNLKCENHVMFHILLLSYFGNDHSLPDSFTVLLHEELTRSED